MGLPVAWGCCGGGQEGTGGRNGHGARRGSVPSRPQAPHCPRPEAGWPARQGCQWGLRPVDNGGSGDRCAPGRCGPGGGEGLGPPWTAPAPPASRPRTSASSHPPWRRTSPLTAAACPPQAAPPAPAASQAPHHGETAPSAPPPPPRSGAASRSPCGGLAGVEGDPPGSGCGVRLPSPQSPLAPG